MNQHEHDEDEEEATPPPRRPRTMKSDVDADDDEDPAPRRARRPVYETDEDDQPSGPTADEDEDDGEAEEAARVARTLANKIRGGWTEGQKVMDSTSTYAQALKLDENTQLIKFLDDTPYANYARHWVDRMIQGKPATRAYVCLGTVDQSCPLCGMGDRPQAVSAFNVALVGDDGQVLLKTWDVGARLFGVLKNYNNNAKIGPLSKEFFSVSKTGKGGSTQFNVNAVKARDLEEDWDLQPPSESELKSVGKYDASILQIPKKSDLEELVDELSEYD
jgi:hypothetical protein